MEANGVKICRAEGCPSQGKPQPTSNFSRHSRTKDGFDYLCRVCKSRKVKARLQSIKADPELYASYLEKNRAWGQKHRDTNRDRYRKTKNEYAKRNIHRMRKLRLAYNKSERGRAGTLRRHYGISLAEYDQMFSDQNGRCAGCGDPIVRFECHTDHDHSCCSGAYSCGKCIRGLICGSCNRTIGFAKERIEALIGLAKYLSRWKEKDAKRERHAEDRQRTNRSRGVSQAQ